MEWNPAPLKKQQSSMISSPNTDRGQKPWVEDEWESISVCQAGAGFKPGTVSLRVCWRLNGQWWRRTAETS